MPRRRPAPLPLARRARAAAAPAACALAAAAAAAALAPAPAAAATPAATPAHATPAKKPPARPRLAPVLLRAAVPARGDITFALAGGGPVTTLVPGIYRVVVDDRSATAGFAIDGPRVHRRTTDAGTGRFTWTVVLGSGRYAWSSTAPGGHSTEFTVRPASAAAGG